MDLTSVGALTSIFTSASGIIGLGAAYWLAGPRQLKPTNTEAKVITARKFPRITTVQKFAVRNESALYLKFGASDVTKVPLKVFNVKVEKEAAHSLVLHDKMKVNASVMFQVSIDDTNEAVIKAAEALNGEFTDENVKQVAEARFDNALRLAAANMIMEEINSNRVKFIEGVREHLKLEDLGLKLNEVSVQTLNPALLKDYDENNSFDAVGKQLATQIVETSKKTRNEIEQLAATQIAETNKAQELTRYNITQEQTQARLAMEENVAKSTAEQARRVAEIQASNEKEAQLAKTQAEQEVGARNITKAQQLQLAEVSRDQAVALATQDKTKKTREAEIATQTAVETAERDKEIKLSLKNAESASAQAKANEARATAVVAEQAVETARAVAEADRSKQIEIIAAETEAGRAAAGKRIDADAEVYVAERKAEATRTEAQGIADAALIDANADAEATRVRASAEYEKVFQGLKAIADGKLLDAEALSKLNDAVNVLSDAARAQQVDLARITASPEVVKAMTSALGSVDKFTVLSGMPGMGGGSGDSGAASGSGNSNMFNDLVKAIQSVTLSKPLMASVLEQFGGDPRIADVLPGLKGAMATAAAPAVSVPVHERANDNASVSEVERTGSVGMAGGPQ